MANFTITELAISEDDKKLVALAPAVTFTKGHVFVQAALYVLFTILFFWSAYIVSGISVDGFLERLFYWLLYFFIVSIAFWMLLKISAYIQKEFILSSNVAPDKNVKRFLLKGNVLAKRHEIVGHEIDEYYISLDQDYELKVYQTHFNSCKVGSNIEIKVIVMDYQEGQSFPNRGIIIESLLMV